MESESKSFGCRGFGRGTAQRSQTAIPMTPGLPPLFRAKYPPAGYNQIPNQVLNHWLRYHITTDPATASEANPQPNRR